MRQLFFRETTNVFYRVTHSAKKARTDVLPRSVDFALRDPRAAAMPINAIELFGPGRKRHIATFADIGNDIRGDSLSFPVVFVPRANKSLFDRGSKFHYSHQSTILFNGYSTMP